MINTCSIEWCNNKHKSKWLCNKHYMRLNTHWDPLFTKRAQNWENRNNHPLYQTYRCMKTRCYNINRNDYMYYWWRWISVCDRRLWIYWFTNFIEDMWERPEWMTLDRIDNDLNYCPKNCKWSTKHEQSSNKRNNNKRQ